MASGWILLTYCCRYFFLLIWEFYQQLPTWSICKTSGQIAGQKHFQQVKQQKMARIERIKQPFQALSLLSVIKKQRDQAKTCRGVISHSPCKCKERNTRNGSDIMIDILKRYLFLFLVWIYPSVIQNAKIGIASLPAILSHIMSGKNISPTWSKTMLIIAMILSMVPSKHLIPLVCSIFTPDINKIKHGCNYIVLFHLFPGFL